MQATQNCWPLMQVAEALKVLVGEHNFDYDQQEVFVYLVSQMRRLTAVSPDSPV